MNDKVCLVTGGSRGIGLATCVALSRTGAVVTFVCRSSRRGQTAIEQIKRLSGNSQVRMFVADLASQSEIRRLASDIGNTFEQLHVLVNNAAVVTPHRMTTVDGLETQFAINHLAPFLLTRLLLPIMIRSAPSRIINVASNLEAEGSIDFEDLQGQLNYDRRKAYNQSKLANVLFTYELSRQIEGSGVTANCLHPGVVETKLLDNLNYGASLGRLRAIARRRIRGSRLMTADEAARTAVRLATSPELENVSGRYFVSGQPAESSPRSMDRKVAIRLWKISEQLVGGEGLQPEPKQHANQ